MTGYEKSDVRFAAIAKGFAGIGVMLAVVAVLSWETLRGFGSRAVPGPGRTPPPGPRLQADPAADLRRMRAEEDAALSGYAWADRSRGRIRLPIERAMALLLARGLPTRGAAPRPRS
ncbi:MAG TPA: hypothetical protein VH309_02170 [Elusimicrobiota bacterium]|jgi:hypothetical protein|nr:hypothetical protein [Elusimicrobiota bacterium]